jgi:hypothetical protein
VSSLNSGFGGGEKIQKPLLLNHNFLFTASHGQVVVPLDIFEFLIKIYYMFERLSISGYFKLNIFKGKRKII